MAHLDKPDGSNDWMLMEGEPCENGACWDRENRGVIAEIYTEVDARFILAAFNQGIERGELEG